MKRRIILAITIGMLFVMVTNVTSTAVVHKNIFNNEKTIRTLDAKLNNYKKTFKDLAIDASELVDILVAFLKGYIGGWIYRPVLTIAAIGMWIQVMLYNILEIVSGDRDIIDAIFLIIKNTAVIALLTFFYPIVSGISFAWDEYMIANDD